MVELADDTMDVLGVILWNRVQCRQRAEGKQLEIWILGVIICLKYPIAGAPASMKYGILTIAI